MRELPKNPNTRPPYSDVLSELSYYLREVVGYLGVDWQDLGPYERKNLVGKLRALDQALVRTGAVLDPSILTDQDWEQASKTAWQVEGETHV